MPAETAGNLTSQEGIVEAPAAENPVADSVTLDSTTEDAPVDHHEMYVPEEKEAEAVTSEMEELAVGLQQQQVVTGVQLPAAQTMGQQQVQVMQDIVVTRIMQDAPVTATGAEVVNLYVQWQNVDALCWLDVLLCMLVYSPTMTAIMTPERQAQLEGTILSTLLKAHQQAQTILQNLLSRASQLENQLQAGTAGTQTGVTPSVNIVNKANIAEIGQAVGLLYSARETIWKAMQPRLRCEKGKHDSPVFAMPLLAAAGQRIVVLKSGSGGLQAVNPTTVTPAVLEVLKKEGINIASLKGTLVVPGSGTSTSQPSTLSLTSLLAKPLQASTTTTSTSVVTDTEGTQTTEASEAAAALVTTMQETEAQLPTSLSPTVTSSTAPAPVQFSQGNTIILGQSGQVLSQSSVSTPQSTSLINARSLLGTVLTTEAQQTGGQQTMVVKQLPASTSPAKIMPIAGQSGVYRLISPGRNPVQVEQFDSTNSTDSDITQVQQDVVMETEGIVDMADMQVVEQEVTVDTAVAEEVQVGKKKRGRPAKKGTPSVGKPAASVNDDANAEEAMQADDKGSQSEES
nr:hypothetical protein BaRGS_003373 [Batillaria attramentaria]